MVPTRRQPGKGAVAAVTRLSRFLAGCMAGSLARSLTAIVASTALPHNRRTMVIPHAQPSGGIEVTTFARRIGHDVLVILWSGDYAFTDSMTTVTGARRTLEHPTDMAALARRRGMAAGKRKAGRHMVEIAPDLLSRPRLQRRHRQQHGKHCTDKT